MLGLGRRVLLRRFGCRNLSAGKDPLYERAPGDSFAATLWHATTIKGSFELKRLHDAQVLHSPGILAAFNSLAVFHDLRTLPELSDFDAEDFLTGARAAHPIISTLMLEIDEDESVQEESGPIMSGSRREKNRYLQSMVSPALYEAMKQSMQDIKKQGSSFKALEMNLNRSWINRIQLTRSADSDGSGAGGLGEGIDLCRIEVAYDGSQKFSVRSVGMPEPVEQMRNKVDCWTFERALLPAGATETTSDEVQPEETASSASLQGAGEAATSHSEHEAPPIERVPITLAKPMGLTLEEGPRGRGAFIHNVLPGAAMAAKDKLQVGDELIEVQGRRISALTFDDVMAVLRGAGGPMNADPVDMCFQRRIDPAKAMEKGDDVAVDVAHVTATPPRPPEEEEAKTKATGKDKDDPERKDSVYDGNWRVVFVN